MVFILRIEHRHSTMSAAIDHLAAVVDAQRLTHCLGHSRLSFSSNRARFFDDGCHCFCPTFQDDKCNDYSLPCQAMPFDDDCIALNSSASDVQGGLGGPREGAGP